MRFENSSRCCDLLGCFAPGFTVMPLTCVGKAVKFKEVRRPALTLIFAAFGEKVGDYAGM